jgi:broad specificity phosphatase PhoE
MDTWMQNWQTAAPPGGESTIALQTRVSACLGGLAEDPAVLCVTHAGVIRAAWVLAGIGWTAAMGTPVDYLRVYRVPSSLPLEGRPSGAAH